MNEAGERLKRARITAGFPKAVKFCEKFGFKPSSLSTHEKGNRSIDAETAERYAAVLGVSPSWLLFGEETIAVNIISDDSVADLNVKFEPVNIIGAVEAGVFKEAIRWEREDWGVEIIPRDDRFPEIHKFCLEIRGYSMDLVYQPEDIIICVDLHDLNGLLEDGKRYVVYKTMPSGEIEATCKELRIDADGRQWLWPRSTKPEHQAPIEINGGGDVHIHARVIGSMSRE
ncbi:MAG: XRE family transcriptional regulator [Sneathiella sp.]